MDYVEFCELMTRRMRDVNEEEEVFLRMCSTARYIYIHTYIHTYIGGGCFP
jgi:hypothetical protein